MFKLQYLPLLADHKLRPQDERVLSSGPHSNLATSDKSDQLKKISYITLRCKTLPAPKCLTQHISSSSTHSWLASVTIKHYNTRPYMGPWEGIGEQPYTNLSHMDGSEENASVLLVCISCDWWFMKWLQWSSASQLVLATKRLEGPVA